MRGIFKENCEACYFMDIKVASLHTSKEYMQMASEIELREAFQKHFDNASKTFDYEKILSDWEAFRTSGSGGS